MKFSKTLFWLPRILTILFIAFISLFALDVFWEDWPWYEKIIGFLMHLIPSFVLIGLLILSWKKEKLGGWLFILLGLIFTVFFKTYIEWQIFALISGPPLLVGILFLISSKNKTLN
ncbi:hypothetical protein ACFL1Y_00800 [Patescibacteria group bacterium]